MNVGTRYPEGRIGRPREVGGRHVRKEEERLRKGGPEGLRKAHEARAGHGPENAGAQGVVQGDREGAGQVALDGERRGGVAQVRDGAEGQARRARGRLRRPVGGLPAPGGVAAMLQRLRPVPRDRLQAPPARLLRGPGRAAVRRLGPRLVQARDRRRRARRGGQAGGDKGLPAPGAVARADGGAQRRPGGPVAVDHLPLGLGGLRRHDQHGAQAQGRLQAEEARRGPGGDPPLRPQVACRVPRPRGGRVRRGLGDGHRRGGPGGLRLPAHAAAPPQQAPARAAAGGEDRRVRRGRPGGRPGHPRRRRDAPRVPRRPHRQRRRVLRRGGDRGAARRGAGRDEAVLLRPQAQRPEGRLRAQPRRDQEAAAQGRRNQVRPARPGRPGAGHVARELRAPRRARLRDARARLQGDARGGRGGAAGRLRRGGRAHRGTRPDAGAHREGARREGRCPAGLA